VLAVTAAVGAAAQTGSLQGTIRDEKNRMELIGANILVVGTTLGGSTDLDGKFEIHQIPPGTYELRITCTGYETKLIPGVVIDPGKSNKINIKLTPDEAGGPATFMIEELRVTAGRILSTDAALHTERIKAGQIRDAISAEQISRSPDGTSSEVLKRVTGLSIVDNKYVFVRGVTDRYNSTALNGVTVTSTDTDADKKSFSFDMIPASLLSNTVVIKSASPDLSGDFSGGFVKVNTLDFPSERTINLSVGTSYNTLATGRDMMTNVLAPGGSKDWLGYDDGRRALPEDFNEGEFDENNRWIPKYNQYEKGKQLANTWGLRNFNAPLNGSYSLSYGDRYELFGKEIGLVSALVYKNSYDFSKFWVKGYPWSQQELHHGNRSKFNVLWGGILNLTTKPVEGHKISFNGNYVQSGKEEIAVSSGPNQQDEDVALRQRIEWDERSLFVSQIKGKHELSFLDGTEAEWSVFYSNSQAAEPDRKWVDYRPPTFGDPNDPSRWYMKDNTRSWFELQEDTRGFKPDLTFTLGDSKIKVGALYENRERTYQIEAWNALSDKIDWAEYWWIPLLPINEIFAPENYGKGKLYMLERSSNTGDYLGKFDLYAFYHMLDIPFFNNKLRFVGGWRIERSDQTINTIKSKQTAEFERVISTKSNSDFLPSGNVTCYVTDYFNVRLGASRSINRPEFRELANTRYFDMDKFRNVIGNPNLKRAQIQNYDIRFELYPEFGEVLAFSYFYKKFKDPIEEKLLRNPERFVQTWANAIKAENHGFEIEFKKSLSFLGEVLKNYHFMFNYTKVTSSVDALDADTLRVRTMQGQHPWTANVSVSYEDPEFGASFSVLYHAAGRHLADVGDIPERDVYEERNDQLDLALAKTLFGGRQRLKFAVKNITGSDDVYTMGDEDNLYRRVTLGTQYSLTLSYRF
jgi:outer membrane receptor protein involved in Fe transport